MTLLALPAQAAPPTAACPPPGFGARLSNVSRTIVPIGATTVRYFRIDAFGISNVQLSMPAAYGATQVPAVKGAYGVRFKAPAAGPVVVTATWTGSADDENGNPQPCIASETSNLNAARGTPLKLVHPAIRHFPGVGGTQYDLPLSWTWKCTANTDPTPLTATVRWEIDGRQLPLFSKGGHAPFKLRGSAKGFTIATADPCDARSLQIVRRTLLQRAKFQTYLGGDVGEGGGSIAFGLSDAIGGIFRVHGHAAPFHLAVVLKQGSRTILNNKLCAWYHESGFLLAKGKNVSCWW